MRGRWAAAAVGASVAKNKAQSAAAQQQAANQKERPNKKQSNNNRNLTQQHNKLNTGQEDITQKLQKLANLKQQGLISEEEYQKSKADLLAKL